MAPPQRRGVKPSKVALHEHASPETRKSIQKAKVSHGRVTRTRTAALSGQTGILQPAVSCQRSLRKESKPAGKTSPATSSKAASTSSKKPNEVDKTGCNKDETRSKASRRDQGGMASTKPVGAVSRSAKTQQRPSHEQAPAPRPSVPKGPKAQNIESDDSDEVDNPDCAGGVSNKDPGPPARVTAADDASVTVPKLHGRSGRSTAVARCSSQKTGIQKRGSTSVRLKDEEKKPQPQDTGHQRKEMHKACTSNDPKTVSSSIGSVAVTAGRPRKQCPPTVSSRPMHLVEESQQIFRDPIAKKQGSLHKCSVKDCPYADGNDEVGAWLFALPSEEEEPSLRSAWLEAIPINIESNRPVSPRVCFRHFVSQKDFVSVRHRVRGLQTDAVPSIHIPRPKAPVKTSDNPVIHDTFQPQNKTVHLSTGTGLATNSAAKFRSPAANIAAGSNTLRQEVQSTVATKSAAWPVTSGSSVSATKCTKVEACTMTDSVEEGLHAAQQPTDTFGRSSSSTVETTNNSTAEHTETSAHTMTETAGESLHTALDPKGAISPSANLMVGAQKDSTSHATGVSAQAVTEATKENLHAIAKPRGAVNPSVISMTETPKQAAVESPVVGAQALMGTTENLCPTLQPVGAISPSSEQTVETPKEAGAESIQNSAHTPTDTTRAGSNNAPQPKEAISTALSSTTDAQNKAAGEPAEVGPCPVAEKAEGTLQAAQEPGDDVSPSASGSMLEDRAEEAPDDSTEVSGHAVPLKSGKNSQHVAAQPNRAVDCPQSSVAEIHKMPGAPKVNADARSMIKLSGEESGTVLLKRDATDKGDTGLTLETEDGPSSPMKSTFSTTFESVSAKNKNRKSSDSESVVLQSSIVELSPASTITLSSDEDDSRPSRSPRSDHLHERARNAVARSRKLPPPMIQGAANPPAPFSGIMRDGKEKATVARHVSGMGSNPFGHFVSTSCDSGARVVGKVKTRCPPYDIRDSLSHAMHQVTDTVPGRLTSFDRQRLQQDTRALAGPPTGVPRSPPNALPSTCDRVPEGVTLFHPSQGRYIIDREVIGDEEEPGMHAISFKVDWVFTGDLAYLSGRASSQQSQL